MLVSASKDSTVKLWDVKTHKLKSELPGHADEVFAIDWSGDKVASGSKDRLLKMYFQLLNSSYTLDGKIKINNSKSLFISFFPTFDWKQKNNLKKTKKVFKEIFIEK